MSVLDAAMIRASHALAQYGIYGPRVALAILAKAQREESGCEPDQYGPCSCGGCVL